MFYAKLNWVAVLLLAVLAVGSGAGWVLYRASAEDGPLAPKVPEGPTSPAKAPPTLDKERDAFAGLLAAAAAGQRTTDDVLIEQHHGNGSFALYGSGIGFADGAQIKLPEGKLVEVLKAIHAAGFTGWAASYGGFRQPAGGPRMGRPDRLVRSLSVCFGDVRKTVTQLGGGEEFKPLADLCAKISEMLGPLTEKGLNLRALTLGEAFAGLADGKIAPEALTLALTRSSRGRNAGGSEVLKFVQGNLEWTENGLSRRALTRAQQAAAAKRLGALLRDAKADTFPVQLFHPDSLIGLSVSVREIGKRLDMSADVGPYKQDMKRKNPEAQANFDELLAGLHAFFREVRPPR